MKTQHEKCIVSGKSRLSKAEADRIVLETGFGSNYRCKNCGDYHITSHAPKPQPVRPRLAKYLQRRRRKMKERKWLGHRKKSDR